VRSVAFLAMLAVLPCLASPPALGEPLGPHGEACIQIGFGQVNITQTYEVARSVGSESRLRFGLFAAPFLGVELAAAAMSASANDVSYLIVPYSVDLVYRPWMTRKNGLYVLYGSGGLSYMGMSSSSSSLATIHGSNSSYDVGGGLLHWFSDDVGLRFEALYQNGHATQKFDISSLIASVGFTMAFGARARDTDKDGVPDKRDTQNNSPPGAKVDRFGIALDDDADGVPNGIDRDDSTPRGALVDRLGLALDLDHDGVFDGLDKCPDTPAGMAVNESGCMSDLDHDGVFDGLDQCPDTPAGCRVDASGCPLDADHDGVCDGVDVCPDTRPDVQVDARGCPVEVVVRETELMDTGKITTQNIFFESGRADLLPESNAVLDVIGQTLSGLPEARIEVGGHCDERGSDEFNLALSEARARSVADYLLHGFPELKPGNVTVKGYGKSRPLVPGTSPEDLAKNRRVEFVVLNPDALMRVVERRRTLPRDAGAPPDTTR
jgi:outer membrane protein OmpA-like peptidoglycan-associated protein